MRFKKVKVNQTKLCWNEQDLYFHQKTIREYSVKHDSFFHTCLTFCKYVWEKPNLCVKYHTCSFWQMFDFYPTCLEKTKHVGIFTPGCYFPHMFGFWHIGMGKGTHVWKKPHNYMFANVWHFPHMCGKSHWHAYFPLSYGWHPPYTCKHWDRNTDLLTKHPNSQSTLAGRDLIWNLMTISLHFVISQPPLDQPAASNQLLLG